MASTSSLEFLGLTVSCCWTGWETGAGVVWTLAGGCGGGVVCGCVGCCAGGAVGCVDGGFLEGSWLGSWLWLWGAERAGPAKSTQESDTLRAILSVSFISATSAYPLLYTFKPGRASSNVLSVRC